MDRIEFQCENCGAALKVRVALAGRSVQCPRCAKKTNVPALDSTEPIVEETPPPAAQPVPAVPQAPAPATVVAPAPVPVSIAAPVSVAAPMPTSVSAPVPAPVVAAPVPAVAPVPAPAPASLVTPASTPMSVGSAPGRVASPSVDTAVYTKKIAALESELTLATTRAEKTAQKLQAVEAEVSSAKASAGLDADALREEVSVHYAAELKAAHSTITELQTKLSNSYKEHIDAAAPLQKTPAPMVEDRDRIDPNVLLAQLHAVTFGKYLRRAILLHIIIIALTSVGSIMHLVRPQPPVGEAGVEKSGAEAASPAVAPAKTVSEVKKEVQMEPEPPPPAPVARPRSTLEKELESVPAPGESAPKSNVSLEGDL